MSVADWLRRWGREAPTSQRKRCWSGLIELSAQQAEALESALGDMPLATTQREDVLAAIQAGEDFKKQHE